MTIAIDSNVFIYYLEDSGKLGELAHELLESIVSADHEGSATELVFLEMLSDPDIDDQRLKTIDDFLANSAVEFNPLDKNVLLCAAELRRKNQSLKTPDALHIASAILHNVDIFVTNDRRLTKLSMPELKVVSLENIGGVLKP